MENDKWERTITPEHDVTLPFTRMVAGPMDLLRELWSIWTGLILITVYTSCKPGNQGSPDVDVCDL